MAAHCHVSTMLALFERYVARFARRVHMLKPLCCCSALEGTKPRIVSYEEQVSTLREQLAEVYAEEDDFSKAAQLLSGIDLDSGSPHVRSRQAVILRAVTLQVVSRKQMVLQAPASSVLHAFTRC